MEKIYLDSETLNELKRVRTEIQNGIKQPKKYIGQVQYEYNRDINRMLRYFHLNINDLIEESTEAGFEIQHFTIKNEKTGELIFKAFITGKGMLYDITQSSGFFASDVESIMFNYDKPGITYGFGYCCDVISCSTKFDFDFSKCDVLEGIEYVINHSQTKRKKTPTGSEYTLDEAIYIDIPDLYKTGTIINDFATDYLDVYTKEKLGLYVSPEEVLKEMPAKAINDYKAEVNSLIDKVEKGYYDAYKTQGLDIQIQTVIDNYNKTIHFDYYLVGDGLLLHEGVDHYHKVNEICSSNEEETLIPLYKRKEAIRKKDATERFLYYSTSVRGQRDFRQFTISENIKWVLDNRSTIYEEPTTRPFLIPAHRLNTPNIKINDWQYIHFANRNEAKYYALDGVLLDLLTEDQKKYFETEEEYQERKKSQDILSKYLNLV